MSKKSWILKSVKTERRMKGKCFIRYNFVVVWIVLMIMPNQALGIVKLQFQSGKEFKQCKAKLSTFWLTVPSHHTNDCWSLVENSTLLIVYLYFPSPVDVPLETKHWWDFTIATSPFCTLPWCCLSISLSASWECVGYILISWDRLSGLIRPNEIFIGSQFYWCDHITKHYAKMWDTFCVNAQICHFSPEAAGA